MLARSITPLYKRTPLKTHLERVNVIRHADPAAGPGDDARGGADAQGQAARLGPGSRPRVRAGRKGTHVFDGGFLGHFRAFKGELYVTYRNFNA